MKPVLLTVMVLGTLMLVSGAPAATVGKGSQTYTVGPCGPPVMPQKCPKDYSPGRCVKWTSVQSGGKTHRCCVQRGPCVYSPVIR